jgi:hypothetical protein
MPDGNPTHCFFVVIVANDSRAIISTPVMRKKPQKRDYAITPPLTMEKGVKGTVTSNEITGMV